MLAGKYCLEGKSRFERVEKEGRIVQSDSFGLAFYERGGDTPSCFGFIVSNKIASEATSRNRIKRAMKEAVRHSLTEIKLGYDAVFLVKQKVLRNPTDKIMLEVKTALKESGISR